MAQTKAQETKAQETKAQAAAKAAKGEVWEKFRQMLQEKRTALIRQAQTTLKSDMVFSSDDRFDEVDEASDEYMQAFSFRLRGRERYLLDKIDLALKKIYEGTYGICEECEEPISLKRLQAHPEAPLCIQCKGLADPLLAALGALERDDLGDAPRPWVDYLAGRGSTPPAPPDASEENVALTALFTAPIAEREVAELVRRVLAQERAVAVPAHTAVGVDDDLVAGEARVANQEASHRERQVLVKAYGTLAADSPLLVEVPGVGGMMRLHKLAAAGFTDLAAAIKKDLKLDLKIASGWRPHRWKSRADYESFVAKKYGSVADGKRFLAYDSPHETGLVMDIGVGGLKPDPSTIDEQRKTKLHAWMVAHASEFGWYPNKVEPWHWEFPISVTAWKTGVAADDDVVLLDEDDEGATEDEFDVG